MIIPSVSLTCSKTRLCQGFIRAYGHELSHLQRLLEKNQIDQATYDAAVLAIDHDIEYLLSLSQALQPILRAPASPDP